MTSLLYRHSHTCLSPLLTIILLLTLFPGDSDAILALPQTDNFYTGHLTGEDYALVGFDAAF